MKKIKSNSFKQIMFILLFIILLDYGLLSSEAQTEFYINKVTNIPGASVGYKVDIDGNYAYITDNNGYMVVNIQNPAKPKKIGRFELDESAFGIFVEEDIAYIAAGGYGLFITDVSNPANPTFLGQKNGDGITNNIYVFGSYAYLSNYDKGLQIFNIEDLTNPIEINEYSLDGRADSVVVKDNFAYVANPNSGVNILNVTIPSSPQKIRTLSATGGAKGLSLFENLLFVGCFSSNVLVFDISTPSEPVLLGTHTDNDDGETHGVAGNSTHLFVADYNGVEFLDITNLPTISKAVEYRKRVSSVHDIDFTGNFLYIAGGKVGGNMVFEISRTQKSPFLGIYIGVPLTVVILSFVFIIIYKRIRKMS